MPFLSLLFCKAPMQFTPAWQYYATLSERHHLVTKLCLYITDNKKDCPNLLSNPKALDKFSHWPAKGQA